VITVRNRDATAAGGPRDTSAGRGGRRGPARPRATRSDTAESTDRPRPARGYPVVGAARPHRV